MPTGNRFTQLPVHAVVVALLMLTVCRSHPEVNPLSFLRHERVSIGVGKFDGRFSSLMRISRPTMFTIRAEETVKVVADPPVLNQSGEWVRVSWSGVVIPQKLDWIGVWLLPNESFNIDAKHQAPVKYQVQYRLILLH